MNKSLIEIKVYLINKYLNKDYSVDDTTTHVINGEKIEYAYINNLLFRSLEKALQYYLVFEILGTTKEVQNHLMKLKKVVEKWNEEHKKYSDKETDIFIQNYNIDIEEIDTLLLISVNDSLKVKLKKQ